MEREQKLYLRVIIQALEDSVNPANIMVGCETPEESRNEKLQSIIWLKSDSQNFRDVCDLAKIDARWLREKILNSNEKDIKKLINEYYKLIGKSTLR